MQQQQNLAAVQQGVQQGGNLQQGAQQGNFLQPEAQQGQFMHQLQGIRQDLQQGGAQQGRLLQQNLNQVSVFALILSVHYNELCKLSALKQ